ncbi:AP-1 complex-associated regulatory protein isoform X2 [Varanus komodoensis]|uniref:AP-1 complex-associated regulatory protein isoform X2 n=1 Tax=Varanus komodoensis TaxID=61221 RepID=UPI001CF78C18|nr:AP-1 complex-associated regulatory protein isoform X2 [Varanus komodoensis]
MGPAGLLICIENYKGIIRDKKITKANILVSEEINPDCSLEGQILKMKLKYFGHLMRRKDSLEKSLRLGTIDGKRRRGRQRMRSKYFRTCPAGEHFTIEFENLVESDEGESPGSSQRPLTEEEIADLRERHYNSIAEKQRTLDDKIQAELAIQEEKLRIEEETLYAAQREAARAAKQRKLLEQRRLQKLAQRTNNGDTQSSTTEEDLDTYLRNVKPQYEAFRSSRLSSDATVLTPNTESSCDLMTKTKSTSGNDDSNSLDLEWEDEEGMNRMIPLQERSKTEEDILRAALKFSSKKTGSNPASASDDSNGLEWENDFVSAEMDDNGNSEYAGFVNPVLELSASEKHSDADRQDR